MDKTIMADIVIIDSGVSKSLKESSNIIGGCHIVDSNTARSDVSDYIDSLGHGTAVVSRILRQAADAKIYIIKIFDHELECEENVLMQALAYVIDNIECKIINISSGVTCANSKQDMYDLCKKLYSEGVTIVAAFDNEGAITYPAAFDCVIGVDSSSRCKKETDYIFVKNSVVNLIALGGRQRVNWNDKEIIIYGTSFAAANTTGNIFSLLKRGIRQDQLIDALKEHAMSCLEYPTINQSTMFKINRAIAFPYNKEVHSLLNFADLLPFVLEDIYDARINGNVSKKITSIYSPNVSYIIKSFDSINWADDKIDTVIVGHIEELENIARYCFSDIIIEKCKKNGKQIFCFDQSVYQKAQAVGCTAYCPRVTELEAINVNFNKLFNISIPVLGVYGTSSQQGKFTLQLLLRKNFIQTGYRVGQLGTEPSSLLFGFDACYPMGYRSNVQTRGYQSVLYLNKAMEQIANNQPEIIITGSQSGSSLYWQGNLAQYPIPQIEFLLGTLPDAIILCVNPYDDFDYIERTIKTLEGLTHGKVIALVLFPMTYQNDWNMLMGKKTALTEHMEQKIISSIYNRFKIKTYRLGQRNDISDLFNECLTFFSEENN